MSKFSDFFGGSGGGLYAVPPKRIMPAGFGGKAAFNTYQDAAAFPCAAGSGTYFTVAGMSATGNIVLKNLATGATIATIAPAAVNAGASPSWSPCLHYDDVGRVLYVIATNTANQIQLAAINDTTGSVAKIGGLTAPTTIGNWLYYTTNVAYDGGYSFLNAAGALIFINNGVAHSLNVATGAINYQNSAYTLSDGTAFNNLYYQGSTKKAAPYITADNSAAILLPSSGGSGSNAGGVSFAKGGILAPNIPIPDDLVSSSLYRILRTSAWVGFLNAQNSSGPYIGWRFYDPVDFDRYVHDLIFAIAGV